MHTDWIDFAKRSTSLNRHEVDRMRRMVRAMYEHFDGVFALNQEHQNWLSESGMDLPKEKVFKTAHWADDSFYPRQTTRASLFPNQNILDEYPVLFYAGRISKEKGVLDLPHIYAEVIQAHPNVKFVIAGTGPAEEELKLQMPEAIFLGWVQQDLLPDYYSAADMLLLPSTFDTFGCVVLEAMACGTPVSAYATKGPKDIIEDQFSGILSKDRDEMAQKLIEYLNQPEDRMIYQDGALKRAKHYNATSITQKLLKDMGMKI